MKDKLRFTKWNKQSLVILAMVLVFWTSVIGCGGGSDNDSTGGGGDGTTTWTAVTNNPFNSGTLTTFSRIAFGGGKFVAGGLRFEEKNDSGILGYSADGINWTEAENHPFNLDTSYSTVNEIAYGNGVFVAADFNGTMAYSSDGINWAKADTPFKLRYNEIMIVYGNGRFVAYEDKSGNMAYSTDGIAWTEVTDKNSRFYNSLNMRGFNYTIAYGNGKFYAFGGIVDPHATNGSRLAVSISTDSVTWTAPTELTCSIFFDFGRIVYDGKGKFINYYSGYTFYSSDGIDWKNVEAANRPAISSITYGNGRFAAIGTKNGKAVIAYSADGITWTEEADSTLWAALATDSTLPVGAVGIAYGNGRYVVLGSGLEKCAIAYSNKQ